MSGKVEKAQLQELSLSNDFTPLFLAALHSKGQAIVDMLITESKQGQPPFFSVKGVVKEGQQYLDIEWPSMEEDAEALEKLIEELSNLFEALMDNNQLAELVEQLASRLKEKSPLMDALGSRKILPTEEQVYEDEELMPPWQHIIRVAKNASLDLFLGSEDILIAALLPWLHDLGKMAGVNFLDEIEDISSIREQLKLEYKKEGKHTHPKHAFVGTIVLIKLFKVLRDKYSGKSEQAHLDEFLAPESESLALLLNVVLHHHHFLRKEKERNIPIVDWLRQEIETQLKPTLPKEKPELVVRFFRLLFYLRLADIKATPAHHKHWKKNMEWIRQVPDILREILPETDQVKKEIKTLEQFIVNLPEEVVSEMVEPFQ